MRAFGCSTPDADSDRHLITLFRRHLWDGAWYAVVWGERPGMAGYGPASYEMKVRGNVAFYVIWASSPLRFIRLPDPIPPAFLEMESVSGDVRGLFYLPQGNFGRWRPPDGVWGEDLVKVFPRMAYETRGAWLGYLDGCVAAYVSARAPRLVVDIEAHGWFDEDIDAYWWKKA